MRLALDAARRAIERARALDARYVQTPLAWLERLAGDHVRAIRHFENAVEEDPGSEEGLLWLSMGYGFIVGRPAAGRSVAERLLSIDPLTATNRFPFGFCCATEGDWTGALAVFEDMDRRDPGLRFGSLQRMFPLAALGRVAEACALADETVAENAGDMFASAVTTFKHALLGDRDAVVGGVTGPLREYYWNDPEFPVWIAGWLALVGENDRALDLAGALGRPRRHQPSAPCPQRPFPAAAAWRAPLPAAPRPHRARVGAVRS